MKRRNTMILAAGVAAFAIATMKRRKQYSRLAGKVVLITGSSRGFGLAIAEEFARHGARIVLTARDANELRRAERILAVKTPITETEILTIPCDLTDPDQVERMVALATQHFGQIDILVNNAGVISVGPLEDQTLDAFKEAIESNYYSMLHATLAVLPQLLKRQKGSIINIASIGGKIAIPHLLPYSASKFAAVGFSQGLNVELRSKGIKVTTVCPGLMRTGSHVNAGFNGDRENEYRWFSLGASLPGISISARSAARQVVAATVRGTSEIVITPQAKLASRFAQFAPNATAAMLGLVNSAVLPAPLAGQTAPLSGSMVGGREVSSLTGLGEAAIHRLNEDH